MKSSQENKKNKDERNQMELINSHPSQKDFKNSEQNKVVNEEVYKKFKQSMKQNENEKKQDSIKSIEVQATCWSIIQGFVIKLLATSYTEGIMTILTFFALFADDIRSIAFKEGADETFYNLTFVCFVFFITEFLLQSIFKPGYLLSFTFWMDFISTVTLIFDIPWLSDAIFGIQFSGSGVNLLKAGRVSRVTTRATRIVRFIRLIRLMRVGKLYKHAIEKINKTVSEVYSEEIVGLDVEENQQNQGIKNQNQDEQQVKEQKRESNGQVVGSQNPELLKSLNLIPVVNQVNRIQQPTIFVNPYVGNIYQTDQEFEEQRLLENPQHFAEDKIDEENKVVAESKISQQLSDLTTRRVIMLIFSIMICIPFFQSNTYTSPKLMYDLTASYFQLTDNGQFSVDKQEMLKFILEHINQFQHNSQTTDIQRYPLIYVELQNDRPQAETYYQSSDYNDIRVAEKKSFLIPKSEDSELSLTTLIISLKLDNDLNSILSLIRTTFMLLLLTGSAIYFTKDSNELILSPIERMLSTVQRIASNPLEAAKIAEDEAVAEQELYSQMTQKQIEQKQIEKRYETSILESTIIKIGALLALGFGEAGSEIVAKNLKGNGNVDPMIQGQKIIAIFGFIAIRNFIDATEVLEERVMIFTNEIAEVVHKVCDGFYGSANKNLGDCFLMIWKYQEDQIFIDKNDEVKIRDLNAIQNFTDQPVLGLIKTLAATYILQSKGEFRARIIEIQRVKKDYKCYLGFGLHVGWAIEGAIGSKYKIDASYLSPNVNLASRLEYATKQYGVPILVSGQIYRLLTLKTQEYMRHVDRVTVKGSKQPMDLYTCDMDTERLKYVQAKKKKVNQNMNFDKRILRVVQRYKKEERYEKIISNTIKSSSLFEKDPEIVEMHKPYNQKFLALWHEGINYYFDGFWEEAKTQLQKTQVYLDEVYLGLDKKTKEDGPIKTILNVMQKENFKSPPGWKGYRALVDK